MYYAVNKRKYIHLYSPETVANNEKNEKIHSVTVVR